MIAVTGATGFIGSHLLKRLSSEGKDCVCLVRPGSPRLEALRAVAGQIREADFGSVAGLTGLLAGCHTLVHLAGLINGSEDELRRVNIEITRNLAGAARAAGVKKIVLVSSVAALRNHGFYGATKLASEREVLGSGVPCAILRPAFTYGAGDRHNTGMMTGFLKKFPVIPLLGGGDFCLQPIYVGDVAEILARMIDRPASNRAYTAAGPEQVPLKEILRALTRHLGLKRLFVPVPLKPVQFVLRGYVRIFKRTRLPAKQILELDKHEAFDISETVREFGVTPVPFREGIRKMFGESSCAA